MDEGPAVSDTSPLIKLAGVGLLELLPAIYLEIWIPESVHKEYQTKRLPADPDLNTLSWLVIKPITVDAILVPLINLGAGEAAAISLAISTNARVVLLDDKLARRIAIARNLPVVGTMAVLLRAKSQGLISSIEPVIDAMIAQGRRISAPLRLQVLRTAGEIE